MQVYLSSLFLHYFDIHYLESIAPKGLNHVQQAELRLATRLAVAAADVVFLPASSYIESADCNIIVGDFLSLFELGIIRIAGSGGNLEGFRKNISRFTAPVAHRPDRTAASTYGTSTPRS